MTVLLDKEETHRILTTAKWRIVGYLRSQGLLGSWQENVQILYEGEWFTLKKWTCLGTIALDRLIGFRSRTTPLDDFITANAHGAKIRTWHDGEETHRDFAILDRIIEG